MDGGRGAATMCGHVGQGSNVRLFLVKNGRGRGRGCVHSRRRRGRGCVHGVVAETASTADDFVAEAVTTAAEVVDEAVSTAGKVVAEAMPMADKVAGEAASTAGEGFFQFFRHAHFLLFFTKNILHEDPTKKRFFAVRPLFPVVLWLADFATGCVIVMRLVNC